MSFDSLQLNPAILKAVLDAGYDTPTPIQTQAIPEILAGHDLIASAQTGTGKTAAFMLPALQRLSETPRAGTPRLLVLAPTRELASQVQDASVKYGRHLRLRSATILGGMPYGKQLRQLSGPLDLVVGTPGRLLDHLERGRLDLSKVEMLILDEADRMLDMGFKEDVERIAGACPTQRQTLLFTATWNPAMQQLAGKLLREPKRIEIAGQRARHENITQRLHLADDEGHRDRLLEKLVEHTDVNKAIIFTATKRGCDELAERLNAAGHPAAPLHGDMSQGLRTRTLSRLRSGRLKLLVATDVAARGLDVDGVSHVINYDIPRFAEDYVHRIGRTGRAGAAGTAVSLVLHRDLRHLDRIERFTGQALEAETIVGLEPTRTRRSSRPAGGRGRPAGRPAGRGGYRSRDGEKGYARGDGESRGYRGRAGEGRRFNGGEGSAPYGERRRPERSRGNGPRRSERSASSV